MRKTYKIFTLFALLVVIGYQVTTISLSHAHFVGQNLIVHYHPFAEGERNTHTHTTEELSLIQNLFPTLISIIALAFFFSVIIILKRVLETFSRRISEAANIYVNHSRGPPSLA